MPRPPRPQKQINEVKAEILEKALIILIEEGYDNFSMSKVGKCMGMTAANIYNYYSNKDELCCAVIIKGYNQLYDFLKTAVDAAKSPFEKVMALIRSYISFGIQNSYYYHLMFSMMAPKYMDCIGTPMEAIAYEEKQSSKRLLGLAIAVAKEYAGGHPGYDGIDTKLTAIQFWSQLHGIISLHNNGNLAEADENTEEVIEGIINNLENIIRKGVN